MFLFFKNLAVCSLGIVFCSVSFAEGDAPQGEQVLGPTQTVNVVPGDVKGGQTREADLAGRIDQLAQSNEVLAEVFLEYGGLLSGMTVKGMTGLEDIQNKFKRADYCFFKNNESGESILVTEKQIKEATTLNAETVGDENIYRDLANKPEILRSLSNYHTKD